MPLSGRMPRLCAFIGIGLSIFGAASAELRVIHSTRSLFGGWTEHLYSAVQTSGPGEVKAVVFGPLFADGNAMTSRAETSNPVLVAPAGWVPFQGYYEESDTALFKVHSRDERFKKEVEFKCYATVILSNYAGMTRKGPRFPSAHRLVFSQDFTLPHTTSSSIETKFFNMPATATGAPLDYSLQTPAFRRPLTYAPGKSGFIAQFGLEFQDGWSKQDLFSLCLEDSRKKEKPWCLRVAPHPRKSRKRFSRQVSFKAASGQGATVTVKPWEGAPKEEELPEEEDPESAGWWVFQIEFTPSGMSVSWSDRIRTKNSRTCFHSGIARRSVSIAWVFPTAPPRKGDFVTISPWTTS